jgi:hypothetical protein
MIWSLVYILGGILGIALAVLIAFEVSIGMAATIYCLIGKEPRARKPGGWPEDDV